jgi:DNA-binding transcriptional regulator YiaG
MKPEEIKEIRESIGITQEKFASLLGTTVCTVNRWENGKTKPSRLYTIQIKELRINYGSYISRRKKVANS